MRLVGASNLYISLPFLMETLVAALVGIGLSALAILAFMQFVIYGKLRPSSNIVEWVDWRDSFVAIGGIAALGILLTLDPDTRDDAQIPQSVTAVGYGRAVHFPILNRLHWWSAPSPELPRIRPGSGWSLHARRWRSRA